MFDSDRPHDTLIHCPPEYAARNVVDLGDPRSGWLRHEWRQQLDNDGRLGLTHRGYHCIHCRAQQP